MFFITLGIILWIALAFWPAWLAKQKGYSFLLFLILSWLVSFVITLIVVLILRDKTTTASDRRADAAADRALKKEYEET
jgi:ABC-type Mn2+/Zn2+ transport system permease subunit